MRSLLLADNVTAAPPPTQILGNSNRKQLSNGILIGIILMFVLSCVLFRFFYKQYDTRRRNRSRSPSFASHDGFIFDNGAVEFNHATWNIRTVGLHQSLIDSIFAFKYKSDDGLVEGTECSVCLNEFQEDDSLRLLPKCSHAFHLPCIDTWLRSHQNCPLCRAPVINGSVVAQVELSNEFGSMNLDASNREPSSDSDAGNESSELRTGEVSSMTREASSEQGDSKTQSDYSSCWDTMTSGDLTETQSSSETETQGLRRSFSLDSSTAQEYYDVVSQNFSGNHHSKASTEKVSEKSRITGNLSLRRLIGNSSIGQSPQIGASSVKRSSSSLGKPAPPSSSVGDLTQPM